MKQLFHLMATAGHLDFNETGNNSAYNLLIRAAGHGENGDGSDQVEEIKSSTESMSMSENTDFSFTMSKK